jgi:hypothetical protein
VIPDILIIVYLFSLVHKLDYHCYQLFGEALIEVLILQSYVSEDHSETLLRGRFTLKVNL